MKTFAIFKYKYLKISWIWYQRHGIKLWNTQEMWCFQLVSKCLRKQQGILQGLQTLLSPWQLFRSSQGQEAAKNDLWNSRTGWVAHQAYSGKSAFLIILIHPQNIPLLGLPNHLKYKKHFIWGHINQMLDRFNLWEIICLSWFGQDNPV